MNSFYFICVLLDVILKVSGDLDIYGRLNDPVIP